jgi:hypothetical protein
VWGVQPPPPTPRVVTCAGAQARPAQTILAGTEAGGTATPAQQPAPVRSSPSRLKLRRNERGQPPQSCGSGAAPPVCAAEQTPAAGARQQLLHLTAAGLENVTPPPVPAPAHARCLHA